MKHIKIILVALLAITLTACSDTNTAEETTLMLETTSDTFLTEEISTTEETTTESVQSETMQSTTVTETETEISSEFPVLAEDIYVLDSAVDANTFDFSVNLPEVNVPYLLWKSDDGNTSVYGVETDELEKHTDEFGYETEYNVRRVIIKHGNIIDTFNLNWRGVYGSVLQVKPFEEQDNCLYASLYSEGGTFYSIDEMVLFAMNSDGNYEVFSPAIDKLVSDITGKVNVSADNDMHTVTFEANGVKYDAKVFEENILAEDIECKSDSIRMFTYDDSKIIFTVTYGHKDYPFSIVNVNAHILFADGEFTIENIDFSDTDF